MNRSAVIPVSSPSRSYGGLGPEERRHQRRQRLLEAGLEVFGTRGLRHSTMRDLCGHARLTDRYFYESFANVQEVFEAVYTGLRAELLQSLEAKMSDAEPNLAGVAEAGLRAFFAFVQDDPRRARIMLIDVLGLRFSNLGDGDHPPGDYAVEPYVRLFVTFFRRLYPVSDELNVDIELVSQTMIGMTVQSAAAWASKGFDKSVDDMVRHNLFAWRGLDEWLRLTMVEWASAKAAASSRAVVSPGPQPPLAVVEGGRGPARGKAQGARVGKDVEA